MLAFLLAAVSWTAALRGWRSVDLVAFPVPLLVLLIWFSLNGGWQGDPFWFGLALLFFLLAALLLAPGRAFASAILALLFGHVFAIVGFSRTPIPITPESILVTFLVWGASLLLFRRATAVIRERENGALLQFPVMIFSLAVSLLLISALATLTRLDWSFTSAALASTGGLLLFLFDGLLATDHFLNPVLRAPLFLRLAFHLSQIALITAVLIHYNKF